MKTKEYWVKQLEMLEHPEGGYYKETFRSEENVTNRNGDTRSASTGIYFMLTSENFSAFHKIESDELFHFYAGSTMSVNIIHVNGEFEVIKVGAELEKGERLQAVIPAGAWFASCVEKENEYALVGCTVAPGFDFQDSQTGKHSQLNFQYTKKSLRS
jgi:predicted cupin superfamily sugar epimerase